MISILHLSDLHMILNAGGHSMKSCILEEAGKVGGRPRGEKLLVLTGDFRDFSDGDYRRAKDFLQELFHVMDIDPAQDVFAVPGNHDVGNDEMMNRCFPGDKRWGQRQRSAITYLKQNDASDGDYQGYIDWRMESYLPFCRFLSELGIHRQSDPMDTSAAAPHVRCWRGKLNLLHLNTTITADRDAVGNQQVDLQAALSDALWAQVPSGCSALAVGHNSFFDLDERNRQALRTLFRRRNICAYLCDDCDGGEANWRRKRIPLSEDEHDSVSIRNIAGVKRSEDTRERYRDFGVYWHEWDEEKGQVQLRLLLWKPGVPRGSFGQPFVLFHYDMPRRDMDASDCALSEQGQMELPARLDALLERTRRTIPLFRLMQEDDIDRRLSPAEGRDSLFITTGCIKKGEEKPVWELIAESWSQPENHSVILEGACGVGKTLTLLSPALPQGTPPCPALYVPLYELVDENGLCLELDEYFRRRLPALKDGISALARRPWQQGPSLLLLLDGFDEIPQRYCLPVIRQLNEWRENRTGVQYIAVAHPMDALDLSAELAGNPLRIRLNPLNSEAVERYLRERGCPVPPAESPAWEVLRLMLPLVLYAKTEVLEGQTVSGYRLAMMEPVSRGALIWNYLQRELLRRESEEWVLRCAVACQYILPYVAYWMAVQRQLALGRERLKELIHTAMEQFQPLNHPLCLRSVFVQYYARHKRYPDVSGVNWAELILNDLDLLVPGREGAQSYEFIHQSFRDALAGMYLSGQAELVTQGTIPALWRQSQLPGIMDYAAELMEEETAEALWQVLKAQNPVDRASLYVQMELQQRRRGKDLSDLDFSGMDLRDISLARYGRGLFQKPECARNTKINQMTLRGVGHCFTVSCVTTLADGRIVSGSWDDTLRVWDSNTGECLQVLEGHTDSVSCVAVLKDGRLVSGAWDNTLRLWNPETGECLRTMTEHTDWVRCVAELDDGRLVTGSDDNTLRVWNTETEECLQVLQGHSRSVNCIGRMGDGRLVSGSGDRSLRVWDLKTGESLLLIGHSGVVNCVSVLSDGRIVSGSDDRTLRVWNLETGESLKLSGHTGAVSCVTVLNDGRIASGSRDNTIRIWNPDTGKCLRVLTGHTNWVNCVTVLRDGSLISGSFDNTLRIWSVNSGTCLRVLGQLKLFVNTITSLTQERFTTGQGDGTLRVWDREQKRCLQVLGGHVGSLNCVAVLGDGRLVNGLDDNTLQVWNPDTRKNLELIGHSDWVSCVTMLDDGRLVSGSSDRTLRVWNPHTGDCLRVLTGHTDWVNCVTVLNNGWLASGSRDNTLRIWDPDTGESHALRGHTDWVRCVGVLEDGLLVSGSNDNTIRVWDPDTGDCLRVLTGHTDSVKTLIALDNGHILSGSNDGTLRVWDVDAGVCAQVIPLTEIDVTHMDLSLAVIDQETARILWQNGARVPEEMEYTGGKERGKGFPPPGSPV